MDPFHVVSTCVHTSRLKRCAFGAAVALFCAKAGHAKALRLRAASGADSGRPVPPSRRLIRFLSAHLRAIQEATVFLKCSKTFIVQALILVLAFTSTVHAQTSRGAITGIVSDPSGAVVSNAEVQLRNTRSEEHTSELQ